MATLTQVAIISRKTIRWSIYLTLALIIGKITLFDLAYKRVFRYFFPEPPPAPTLAFGNLPKLVFPNKATPKFGFTLETPEGTLPKIPTQAKIYYMPKLLPNLLSLEEAKAKASELRFQLESLVEVSQTLYQFKHENAHSTLEINIVTGNFSISYDFGSDPGVLQRRPPAPEIASSMVKNYLDSAELLPKELSGPVSYEFIKSQDGKLVGSISLSEADLVKVYLTRKSFDNIPTLTPDPDKGNVWFMVSGSTESGRQIPLGEYHYFPAEEGKAATYPIKTADLAWQEFSQGGGFVARTGSHSEGDTVKIRRVYLAYYDPGTPTDLLQPILVFDEGVEKGFMGYLPIVASEYYQE